MKLTKSVIQQSSKLLLKSKVKINGWEIAYIELKEQIVQEQKYCSYIPELVQLKQKDSANKNYGNNLGCLENNDPLIPLRPQNLKRKTPFYILELSFYFISNKRVFFLYYNL